MPPPANSDHGTLLAENIDGGLRVWQVSLTKCHLTNATIGYLTSATIGYLTNATIGYLTSTTIGYLTNYHGYLGVYLQWWILHNSEALCTILRVDSTNL